MEIHAIIFNLLPDTRITSQKLCRISISQSERKIKLCIRSAEAVEKRQVSTYDRSFIRYATGWRNTYASYFCIITPTDIENLLGFYHPYERLSFSVFFLLCCFLVDYLSKIAKKARIFCIFFCKLLIFFFRCVILSCIIRLFYPFLGFEVNRFTVMFFKK